MTGKTRHPGGRTGPSSRSSGSSRAGNVVHLRPRQWLETLEDLVPIGAPANGQGDDPVSANSGPEGVRFESPSSGEQSISVKPAPIAGEPHSDGIGGYVASRPEAPSSAASDFWGEDAANVQDALQAPVPAATSGPDRRNNRQGEPHPASAQRPSPLRPDSGASSLSRAHATLQRLASVRFARPIAVAALATGLAVLAAVLSASMLGGAATARSAPKAHSASLTDLRSQAAQVAAMLTPAHIPPLAEARSRSRRAGKRHPTPPPVQKTHVAAVSPSGGETSLSTGSTGGQAASTTYAGSTSRSSAATSASSPAASKPTGPSGVVSLIGAGTSPSG